MQSLGINSEVKPIVVELVHSALPD